MDIVTKENLRVQSIKSIKVYVSQMIFDLASGNEKPSTGLEGKFSIHYALATALLRGDTGLRAFTDEKVNDPEIKEFMKKISLGLDKKLSKLKTIMELETNSGDVYSRIVNVEEVPELKEKKLRAKDKYIDLCGPILGEEKTKDLMELILSLEKSNNMKQFTEKIQI